MPVAASIGSSTGGMQVKDAAILHKVEFLSRLYVIFLPQVRGNNYLAFPLNVLTVAMTASERLTFLP